MQSRFRESYITVALIIFFAIFAVVFYLDGNYTSCLGEILFMVSQGLFLVRHRAVEIIGKGADIGCAILGVFCAIVGACLIILA